MFVYSWTRILMYQTLIAFLKFPAYASPDNSTHITKMPQPIKQHLKEVKPHIIIILADDLGWNDVGFHGSDQIPTPNIDALAYNGIIFNDHYAGPSCVSSRSSLLTGKHFINLGLQHGQLLDSEPRGLLATEKLLPQYLKEAGYKTHAVGKWQLGFASEEYTPINRGFDSHYGFWSSHQDYYSHINQDARNNWSGYDMRSNMSIDWSASGNYSTDLFTSKAVQLIRNHNKSEPLFLYLSYLAPHAPNKDKQFQSEVNQSNTFSHIKDLQRRSYAEKVSRLDKSIGTIIEVLQTNNILQSSLILFLSDNGAPTVGENPNGGSNFPLRGVKGGPWEGSSRTVAVLWSSMLKKTSFVCQRLISITDWLPTLTDIAGVNMVNATNLDGINLWPYLSEDDGGKARTNVVINIDEISNYSSIRYNHYKLITGTTDEHTDWYGDSATSQKASYSAEQVLQSKVARAIAQVIETNEMQFKKRCSNPGCNQLSTSDIYDLRWKAEIRCRKFPQPKPCDPSKSPCLFNIYSDPCETNNIADEAPIVVKAIEIVLQDYKNAMIPAKNIDEDRNADPKLWNGTWTSWLTQIDKKQKWTIVTDVIISGLALLIIGMIIVYFAHKHFKKYNVMRMNTNKAARIE